MNKDFHKYEDHNRINLFRYEALLYTYMAFNLKHPFFSDVRVRRAVSHAIRKQAIVDGVLKRFGRPAHIPNSPVSWAYPQNQTIRLLDYAPDTSKTLLKEAGFMSNPNSKWLDPGAGSGHFSIIVYLS